MKRNLGTTRLRRKRRATDPMRAYDALPEPLRRWLAEAALPWSPTSVRRIWNRACSKGLSPEDALHALSRAEQQMIARDRHAPSPVPPLHF
jgi:hypothetical protein